MAHDRAREILLLPRLSKGYLTRRSIVSPAHFLALCGFSRQLTMTTDLVRFSFAFYFL